LTFKNKISYILAGSVTEDVPKVRKGIVLMSCVTIRSTFCQYVCQRVDCSV